VFQTKNDRFEKFNQAVECREEGLDRSLAVFLIARKLAEDPIEGINMSLPALKTTAAGIVDRRSEQAEVDALIASLRIRCSGAGQDIVELSGGNQQKVLFARWIMRGVSVLLLDEPTRGVDVGAKFDIHAEIRKLAAAGCAVVVVSSEMEELMALADRIIVLSARRIVSEFTKRPWDEGKILAAAFSAHVGARGEQQHGNGAA